MTTEDRSERLNRKRNWPPLSYTYLRMLRRSPFHVSLLVLSLVLSLSAVQKQYETGKIVEVQQKASTRILYYVADTPITKDDPYYQLSVQSKNVLYVGKYVPRHADDTLPVEWQPGAEVDMRADSHHLYLRKPSGVEIELTIVKQTLVTKVETKNEASGPGGK
jgi:hypothetical protein